MHHQHWTSLSSQQFRTTRFPRTSHRNLTRLYHHHQACHSAIWWIWSIAVDFQHHNYFYFHLMLEDRWLCIATFYM